MLISRFSLVCCGLIALGLSPLLADQIIIPPAILQQATKAGLEIKEARVGNANSVLHLKILNIGTAQVSVRIEIECVDRRGVVHEPFKAVHKIEPAQTWSVKQTVFLIRIWTVRSLTVE